MLSRDDIYWVDDVDMSRFYDPDTVYSTTSASLCYKDNPTTPGDSVLVMSGRGASVFLNPYTDYFTNLDEALDEDRGIEHWLRALALLKGLRWELVSATVLPHFLLHLGRRQSGEIAMCLRFLSARALSQPQGPCVHPSLITLPGCEDMG